VTKDKEKGMQQAGIPHTHTHSLLVQQLAELSNHSSSLLLNVKISLIQPKNFLVIVVYKVLVF
jgi:hypothetical protein